MNVSKSAFTLVEIMIVVAIIGLLAMIAIPSFMKARHTSQMNAYINDVRIAHDAFVQYNMDHNGRYPPNASPGVLPPTMTEYLTKFPWSAKPTIGGVWDWDYSAPRANGYLAGISVRNVTWSDTEMAEIDAAIDDGNINTGNFRKFNTDFTYIIE
jgi:prepilin-type N-terminal cleavage/methylation domain-containing protein